MILTEEDMRMTWGDFREVAPHVFRRFDEKGNKVFVLSAEKTSALRKTNLYAIALQHIVGEALK